MGKEDRGGIPDLDPKLRSGFLTSPISISTRPNPTRFLSRYYPPRDISPIIHITDMGEEDRGGLPDLDPKSRSGFFNLPDLDLDPTRFLSRYYPPRDISPIPVRCKSRNNDICPTMLSYFKASLYAGLVIPLLNQKIFYRRWTSKPEDPNESCIWRVS